MRAVAPVEAEALLDSVDMLPRDVAESLSAPFLMCERDEWASARHKIAIFGQETFGWDYRWANGSKSSSLVNGIGRTGRIEALVECAAAFDLGAEYQSSPFWRAYQQIADDLEGGDRRKLLWGNVARCDTSPNEWTGYEGVASVWRTLSYTNLDAMCKWQSALLAAEIGRSSCEAAVFFTGPNYDYLIKRSLPDVRFEPVADDIPARELALVRSSALPELAFRLYHPNYLQRSGRWNQIGYVVDLIRRNR